MRLSQGDHYSLDYISRYGLSVRSSSFFNEPVHLISVLLSCQGRKVTRKSEFGNQPPVRKVSQFGTTLWVLFKRKR